MTKLGEILQEEALVEIGQVLAETESKAEIFIREARKEASDRVAAARKRAEVELQTAAHRVESAAQITVFTARTQARGRMIELVRERTTDAIEEIGRGPNYAEVLKALAEEAFESVEPAEALVIHPDDGAKLSAWAGEKGLELRTNPGLRLGVRIVARGGQRSVENSLPERLRRAWGTLASGVAHRLWRDP